MSALSRAASVGYSLKYLRRWDLRRMICWARLRLKSRTSSKRGELQSSSLCAQREAGLVARCSSVRADPRLRPGRTETGAEALRPTCPIPPGQREEGNRECVDLPSAADASEAWNRAASQHEGRGRTTQRSAADTTLVLLPPEPPPRRPSNAHSTGAFRRLCA